MTEITAKAELTNLAEAWAGAVNVAFGADYSDGRNAAWAAATPALSIQMTVRGDVAEQFKLADKWTVTFTPTIDETPTAAADAEQPTAGTVDAPAPAAAAEPDLGATQPVDTAAPATDTPTA